MMSDIDAKPIVTLLILDDDQQFASSLADSLAVTINANCYCESDPERAMQAIDNQKIDLLIIDIHLGDRLLIPIHWRCPKLFCRHRVANCLQTILAVMAWWQYMIKEPTT